MSFKVVGVSDKTYMVQMVPYHSWQSLNLSEPGIITTFASPFVGLGVMEYLSGKSYYCTGGSHHAWHGLSLSESGVATKSTILFYFYSLKKN